MTKTAEEKLILLEEFFEKYNAVRRPDLNTTFKEEIGLRDTFELSGEYYRADIVEIDGVEYITIGGTDDEKYANVGVTDDLAIFPISYPDEKIEKEVRFLFGIEPYPETYPEYQ
ncbi:MAG TPA: hypothetical protein DCG85_04975 [Lachnospiraceae bacterium]|nr:hypothetical protein [Lachnospiraceae bacterium]